MIISMWPRFFGQPRIQFPQTRHPTFRYELRVFSRQLTKVDNSVFRRKIKQRLQSGCIWQSTSLVDSICAIFTARCYTSAVLAMGLCLSVRLCLCPSVTSRSYTKTAKRRITQTTPHDTPKTLVFWCQRSPRNSTGVIPCGGAKCRWGGSKSATFDK